MRARVGALICAAGAACAATAAMAATGPGGGAAGSPDADAAAVAVPARAPAAHRAAAEGLTLSQLAGQRLVAGFSGRRPSRGLRRMISSGRLAGVILFSDNVRSRGQLRKLSRQLQAIPRPPGLRRPLLVMADQEGGLVRRLPGPPKPSAAEVGRRGARAALELGRASARSMRGMGVNVNLAPVLDVARPGGFIADQLRGYSSKAVRVGRVGTAFARGLEQGGVAATAKHFPGLGAARRTTDEQPVTLRIGTGRLRRVDEAPYRPFVAAGGDLVMLSLARYPALSGRPAALARQIATRELRTRLGFEGVSISDALETPAAAAVGGTGTVARLTVRAGTDLLLYTSLATADRAHRSLLKGLRAGGLRREGFERSVERVLALRARLKRGASASSPS